jgi:hypothetical protein
VEGPGQGLALRRATFGGLRRGAHRPLLPSLGTMPSVPRVPGRTGQAHAAHTGSHGPWVTVDFPGSPGPCPCVTSLCPQC